MDGMTGYKTGNHLFYKRDDEENFASQHNKKLVAPLEPLGVPLKRGSSHRCHSKTMMKVKIIRKKI